MIILGFLGTLLYYAILITVFIISTPFCFLAWLFSLPFDPLRKIPHALNYRIAKLVIFINPFWRIKVYGRENIDTSKTYVIASNHQSLVDILVLYQLYPLQFKFVSKKELSYIPFIGWVMSLAKYVLLDRRDPKSQFKMMRDCEHYLDNGMSIGIFPEGTRSKTGELLRFKDGASMLAKTTGSSILPICMIGNNKAMPEKGFIWKHRVTLNMYILEPIECESDLKELTTSTKEKINNQRLKIINA